MRGFKVNDTDPMRLCVAAHELGHYLAWRTAEIEVKCIRIDGRGRNAHGLVQTSHRRLRDPKQTRGYLVGLLAGRSAGKRWSELNDLEFDEYPSSYDMQVYRRLHKHAWVSGLTDRELQVEASRFVRANWARIERLAPELARRGRL